MSVLPPMHPLRKTVHDLSAAGYSLIPVGFNKRPIGAWKDAQKAPRGAERFLNGYGADDARGVAVVCGSVSGGLMCVDVDKPEKLEPLLQALGRRGLEPGSFPIQETPSGGFHLFYKCPEPGGNTKLAWVSADTSQGKEIAIETRGEGGYAVIAPSELSGGAYRWKQLDLNNAPTLSQEEHQAVLEAAKSLDETPLDEQALTESYRERRSAEKSFAGSVIDTFNRTHTLAELLVENGYAMRAPDKFLSPGSRSGNPGVTVFKDAPLVYSHHSDVLGDGKAHDAFDVFALLVHGGDKKAAYEAAARRLGMWELNREPFMGVEAPVRPQIMVNNRHTRNISADALAALQEANDPPRFFVRGFTPSRVVNGRVEALSNASLKGELDRCADFVKVKAKATPDGGGSPSEATPTKVPYEVPADILSLPDLGLPKLEAIASVPVVLPGGVMLLENGYHEESGILLDLEGLEGIHSRYSDEEALKLLDGVFADFPFAEPRAGRAHALALTLQPFIRPMVQGPTPLYLIDAPARGTGKGLLSETTARIATGSPAPVMSQPKDGDELEKRITSGLLEGRTYFFLDNVTRLDSPHLAAALTSEFWQGRILGKSEMITLPNSATWLATGNNVDISDEFARRIIPIRLDAGVERPEERSEFRHANLSEYVTQQRSALVAACLSLIQSWIEAGMPKGTETLGRYESYTEIMGGILAHAGVEGFLGGRERLYSDADSDVPDWSAALEAWYEIYGKRPVSAKELYALFSERYLLQDLYDGRTENAAYQRIGKALKEKRDRVFGGYKLIFANRDRVTKSNTYRLKKISTEEVGKSPPRPTAHPANAVPDSEKGAGGSSLTPPQSAGGSSHPPAKRGGVEEPPPPQ